VTVCKTLGCVAGSLLLAFGACTSLRAEQSSPGLIKTDPLNMTEPVRAAFAAFYNMNYPVALQRFDVIREEHPGNPLATDYVLDATLFQELNRLDLLDTTFYATDGFLTGRHTVEENPEAKKQIESLAQTAISEAGAILVREPKDVDALYARAWARALLAAYMGLAERAFPTALHLANAARDDDQTVLQTDPNYIDADLVVGTYQYVVGALPFTFRLLIGIVGISGSKTKGMAMLQQAAEHGVLTSVDARTCMMLFLRREAKYGQAIAIAEGLATEYPHDFLFELEVANLQKDSGAGDEAIEQYEKVLAQARRSGYFHSAHLELADYGLGATLRGRKKYAQAAVSFHNGAAQPTASPELKQRCLLAAGQMFDLMHDRARAIKNYNAAIEAGNDSDGGAAARKWLDKPYTGK
jgi:tetratricopeptide (TPR) repeat protein